MLDRPERAVIKYISKIDTDFVSANIFEYQKHIFHRLTVPEEIAAQKIRGAEGEAETLRQKDRILTMLRKRTALRRAPKVQLFIAHRLKGESLRLHYGGTKFSPRGSLCLFKCSKNNADICLKSNAKSKNHISKQEEIL